jgi:hypothetical protein
MDINEVLISALPYLKDVLVAVAGTFIGAYTLFWCVLWCELYDFPSPLIVTLISSPVPRHWCV